MDTAPAHATFSAAGIAVAMLLCGWSAAALGSSGIDIASDGPDSSPGSAAFATAAALVAHTETALTEILDDDTVNMPALADAVGERGIEQVEESDTTERDAIAGSDSPAMITRLPGVSNTVLPSFRRQMHRTDI